MINNLYHVIYVLFLLSPSLSFVSEMNSTIFVTKILIFIICLRVLLIVLKFYKIRVIALKYVSRSLFSNLFFYLNTVRLE